MKLKRSPLKQQALLLVSLNDEIQFSLMVPPKMTTAELLAKAAVALGMREDALLQSMYQIEYFDN